jgi:lipoprotein-anchoring transpeptidase ErfK/SrfK
MSGPHKPRSRRRLLAVAAVVMVAVAAVALFHRGGNRAAGGREAASPLGVLLGVEPLPASPRPAFTPRRPVLLDHAGTAFRWAPVLHPVAARTRPGADARVVADLAETTPEGTANLLLVVGRARVVGGTVWTRVRLAVLPNGTTGWVPRSALGGYSFVHTHLVVNLERLTATLYRDGRPVFRAPVGVGRDDWPTPTGRFYIREKLTRFSSPFYGPLAFGTSARSNVLTDWPGGGFIGIHGTNEPELLPGRVSHGCIRMRNDDILRLARLMSVGTPLTIL